MLAVGGGEGEEEERARGLMKSAAPAVKRITSPAWKGAGRKTHPPPHPGVYSINLQLRRSKPDVGSSRSFSQDKHAKGLGPGVAIKW